MSMALVMSEMPDVVRRVLAEHVADPQGRCAACRNATGGTASWPCQTYRVAQEARWVGEGNLPGTGPHGPLVPGQDRPARRERREPAAGRRPEAPYSLDAPRTGDFPDFGLQPIGSGRRDLPRIPHSGGRRRRAEGDPAPFGSHMDAPYGSSFGVTDAPRHAAR